MPQEPSKDFEESLKQRDKLLEYDRNRYVLVASITIVHKLTDNNHIKPICSACRTKVIDDELDYYQSNSIWLSAAEREKLQKQEAEANAHKHASRLDRKITLDFMGETMREIDEYESNQELSNTDAKELSEAILSEEFEDLYACPSIELERPTVSLYMHILLVL